MWPAPARLLAGAAVLAVLVWRLGTGPFVHGVRTVDGWSLAAATGIAAVTTVCCAWRWSLVARGLGVAVPLGPAVAAYYRSQFLNTTLPGGVLGDLHRGLAAGRDAGDVGRGLRAVGWERTAGQVVQAVLAAAVLLILPSPVRPVMPSGASAALVVQAVLACLVLAGMVLAALVLLARRLATARPAAARWLATVRPAAARSPGQPSRWVRAARAAGSDLRAGVLARGAWPGILAASVVVVAGHVATFLIAARATGVPASPARLLPLALLVLLAMGIPANVGGWGPREGVAAWAFGAAGLGAAQGVATAVAYGVLVLVANLPGVLVLIVTRPVRRHGGGHSRARTNAARPVGVRREGTAHG